MTLGQVLCVLRVFLEKGISGVILASAILEREKLAVKCFRRRGDSAYFDGSSDVQFFHLNRYCSEEALQLR